MFRTSDFLADDVQIGQRQAAFEAWLKDKDYAPSAETDPWAIEAETLVDEFIEEFPVYQQYRSRIKRHAKSIGYISDSDQNDSDEDGADDGDYNDNE